MDIYKEIRLEFDVESLVNCVLKQHEHGKPIQAIVDDIKQNHTDFITLP